MNQSTHIVALVSYKIFPARMGGQKGIALFYKYLSRLLPVTIVSTKNNEIPQDTDASFLPVLSNSKLRYINPFLFFKLKRILREKRATDLILEHPYYGWLGIWLKKSCSIKLIIHSHNIESLRFKSTGKWWWKVLWHYERFVHRNADINFFITDEDRDFALKQFGLSPASCHTITYGFEISGAPAPAHRAAARISLQQLHYINEHETILLFNGTLDYKPNLDALDVILNTINPMLMTNSRFAYKIIICGKGLPAHYNELKDHKEKNILYAGFVDDINVYFKGADIFINPVTDGGGIKTKVVEALGFNLSVISTESGAIGLPASVTGKKLARIKDGDWQSFAHAITTVDSSAHIPQSFFDHFYWGNIARKVKSVIS